MKKVCFRAFLATGLLVVLAGCGNKTPESTEAAARFQAQHSVQCSLEYALTFHTQNAQGEEGTLDESFLADADVDLTQNSCHLTGTITHTDGSDDENTSPLSVEVYSSAQHSYYQYGNTYYSEPAENAYLSLLLAPLSLHLESGYTASDVTELIYGSECAVFTGTEIADDSPQRLIWDKKPQTLSLDGCLIDVTLLVNQATSLPAEVRLNYANLDELEIDFTGEDGTVYTLERLEYTVTYRSYGTEVDVSIPEEFRQAAEAGSLETPAESTAEQTEPTPDGIYELCAADDEVFWRVSTPEQMRLKAYTQSSVTFDYYYNEADLEEITYHIESDASSNAMTDYAQTLAKQYKAMDGVSKVSDGGVRSTTLNDALVKYIVLSLHYAQDGTDYQVSHIVSWTEADDGQTCIVVEITEYNGTDDNKMIDPMTELEYAYLAVSSANQP